MVRVQEPDIPRFDGRFKTLIFKSVLLGTYFSKPLFIIKTSLIGKSIDFRLSSNRSYLFNTGIDNTGIT
jgi:hypothetical protein